MIKAECLLKPDLRNFSTKIIFVGASFWVTEWSNWNRVGFDVFGFRAELFRAVAFPAAGGARQPPDPSLPAGVFALLPIPISAAVFPPTIAETS